mmetsp:Transcript_1304/g.1904  ORF Transcript_1304/g.1904 Transcript_1304/m.1904 type:complete len:87 (-) Transcript_1304:308-568(-)
MDYGTRTINGVYQFNSKYRRTELCERLTEKIPSQQCAPFLTSIPQVCGDGILSPLEECECEKGEISCECCDGCKLRSNAACSPFEK